jgi:transposase-like protein
MRFQEVLALAKLLSKEEQLQLVISLTQSSDSNSGVFTSRCNAFINKHESCPHCGGKRYFRFGRMRGSQRFKCKCCNRTFTEYTGTWLDGLHKKSLAEPYLSLMIEHYSLDRIRKQLNINKKTAFDWRHKILSSYEQDTGNDFEGVVESDETFLIIRKKGIVI